MAKNILLLNIFITTVIVLRPCI